MVSTVPKMFTPLRVGALQLAHRVILAPLTRCRADPGEIQSEMAIEYYTQRTTPGGLLISEATQISPEGQGTPNTPGIFTSEQAAAWKKVTDAVHAKGGFIFAQLWHQGRQSHSSFQPNGGLPVAPSAVPIKGSSRVVTKTYEKVPYETPRALETDEVSRVVADFVHAAKTAKEAGFDGVEIHGANAYLIDQFLHEETNQRTDQYGGSIENRVRFLVETVKAVVDVWGSDRVGVRLSPPIYIHDSNKEALFTLAIQELDKFNIAYIHLIDPPAYARPGQPQAEDIAKLTSGFFRPIVKTVLIENGGVERESGLDLVERGESDAIAYGRLFLANPDLPRRLQENLPMNNIDYATFFTPGPKGYTDYPFYAETKTEATA